MQTKTISLKLPVIRLPRLKRRKAKPSQEDVIRRLVREEIARDRAQAAADFGLPELSE